MIKDIVEWDTLKFKDRDEIEDVFSSWLKCHVFDIEKMRDQRMRGFYKERYDFRKNLVDWDYSMGIKDFAKHMNMREYKDWRLQGIAFETRLAVGNIPNRTLNSFIEGKSVSNDLINGTF